MVSRKKKVASSVLVLRSCDGPEYALVVGVTREMQRKGGVVERAQAVIDGVRDSHVALHCDCEYTVDDVYEALEDAGFVIFQNTIREGPVWDGTTTNGCADGR